MVAHRTRQAKGFFPGTCAHSTRSGKVRNEEDPGRSWGLDRLGFYVGNAVTLSTVAVSGPSVTVN